jgi:pimeloyl-ACP methyl ester carboxylesterase
VTAELEIARLGAPAPGRPTLVFLHEGLGSVGLWYDFPERCVAATGLPALVYSRQGYGRSDPVALPRPLDYMQREAREVLPGLLQSEQVDQPILFGHSDGASIALAYAAGDRGPPPLALALEAPHVVVEPRTTESIAAAVAAFEHGDLRVKLARHHGANVEGAFRGWANAWLDPGFPEALDLRPLLPRVTVPLLLIQERGDPYGTVEQLDAIERGVAGPVTRCWLPGESHSPHREHPAQVIAALAALVQRVAKSTARRE